MNKKKIIWFLSMILCLGISGMPAYAKDKTIVVKSEEEYIQLLRETMLKRKKKVTVSYKGDWGGLVEKAYLLDDPATTDDADYFHCCVEGCSGSHSGTSTYTFFYSESAKQTKSVNKKVKKVVASLKLSGKSRAAKVKKIHDYVAKLITYDSSYNPIVMMGGDHSAYGGLVAKKHTTVCSGYSGIVYKMLLEAGVPCHIITGVAGGQPHAWNLVKIGKKWYHLDVTYDDTVLNGNRISYDYFLVGNKTIRQDHILDEEIVKKYKISNTDYK